MSEEHDDKPGFTGHVGGDLPQPGNNPSDEPRSDEHQWATRGGRGGRGNRGRGRGGHRGNARGGSNRRGSGSQVPGPSPASRSDNNASNRGMHSSNTSRGHGGGRSAVELSDYQEGSGGNRGIFQRSQASNFSQTTAGDGRQSFGQFGGSGLQAVNHPSEAKSWRNQQYGTTFPPLPSRASDHNPTQTGGNLAQSLVATSAKQSTANASSDSQSAEEIKAVTAEEKRKRQTERQDKKRAYDSKLGLWATKERNMPPFPGNGSGPSIVVGSSDTPSLICANFFQFRFSMTQALATLKVYKFELEDDDQIEPTNRDIRRQAIADFLESQPPMPQSHLWVTDYFATIISVGDLYTEPFPCVSQTVVPPWGDKDFAVKVSITFQRDINLSELSNLVNGRSTSAEYRHDEDIKALNLITWKMITKDSSQGRCIGKRFFPQKKALCNKITRTEYREPVGPRVFVARTGFFTSVRPGNGSLLLNINVSTSAFYPAELLFDWMRHRFTKESSVVDNELVGLKVKFVLDQEPRATRRIARVGKKVTIQNVGKKGAKNAKLMDRMKNNYASEQFDPEAFAIGFGDEDHSQWLPADKLIIEPWQPLRTKIDPDFADSMIAIAAKHPAEVRKLIMRYAVGPLGIRMNEIPEETHTQPAEIETRNPHFQETGFPEPEVSEQEPQFSEPEFQEPEFQEPDTIDLFQDFLPSFGFDPAKEIVELNSRELQPPVLEFGNKKDEKLFKKAKDKWASWDLTDKKFHIAKDCGNLSIIIIGNKHDYMESGKDRDGNPRDSKFDVVTRWAKNFVKELRKYGLTCLQTEDIPPIQFVAIQRGSDYQKRRADWQDALGHAYDFKKVGLLVIILPRKEIKMYSDIKWWTDCVVGVPSMGVQQGTLQRMRPRHFGNLCLKANLKLGGTNHNIMGGNLFPGSRQRTMVVGADVSHTQMGSDPTCPSLAAVVGTCDHASWQYTGSARLQGRNTEHIAELGVMIGERMAAYMNKNGYFPDHILFYRDGVSESQYGMVFAEELPQIQLGAQRAVGNQQSRPKITLLVVGKRHHTRFFPYDRYKEENLTAGLVIDHTVVNPQHFNFYLQSHNSPLGTARSAHYVVIENESGYTPHELQEVTNNLCYTGSRASVSLSVCTPARYADLLCERLRYYMRPFLNGEVAPDPNRTSEHYLKDECSWGMTESDGELTAYYGAQPWHPDLESAMFYL
ncbi:hypothetical protein HYFRA_00013831 [Hymenoscyphus fraxineus]|uniref:Piwi domain-containing protein n=1 Tax=Hymenoscyphus fraxineus TaxID=746836 RepID=A0A9N9PZF1_9HELO|nr:hypothetical protein HYFRA_00013831 [Hymenoscyphus fraxineus]